MRLFTSLSLIVIVVNLYCLSSWVESNFSWLLKNLECCSALCPFLICSAFSNFKIRFLSFWIEAIFLSLARSSFSFYCNISCLRKFPYNFSILTAINRSLSFLKSITFCLIWFSFSFSISAKTNNLSVFASLDSFCKSYSYAVALILFKTFFSSF